MGAMTLAFTDRDEALEHARRAVLGRLAASCAGQGLRAPVGVLGYGAATLLDDAGRVLSSVPFGNLVTTAGDQYYARKAIVGISPANATAPTAVNGMKLGTGTSAATKSGATAAIGTYITGSNVPFDATYPQAAAVGTDVGWQVTYKSTWAAGVATNGAITEVVIVNDQATNAATTAAGTIARALMTSRNKTSTTILEVVWSHIFLGA